MNRTRHATDAPPPSGFVLALAVGFCRLFSFLFRTIERSHCFLRERMASANRLLAATCTEALTLSEKSALTIRIYNCFPDYKRVGHQLHRWEEPWFTRRLPSVPARVLVGACGTGREAVVLADRGYRVDAFEPAPEFVAESRRHLGQQARVFALAYEQLSAIVLDGNRAIEPALVDEQYDAVVLGSGSLTHVLDPREQLRVLQSVAALCPNGPILASFFCDPGESDPAHPGMATRWGRRFGRFIARIRGLPPGESRHVSYRPHSGFAYTYTPEEIERLAQRAGRSVVWERGEMPPFHYVTLIPAAGDSSLF